MKAKLIFDLGDPDDRIEHTRCLKSLDLCCALSEIAQAFRDIEKGNSKRFTKEDFYQIMEDHGIFLGDIMT